MTVTTTAHLNFRGQAREALGFYQSVFGGETTIATYGDVGIPKEAPGAGDVVFGQVTTGRRGIFEVRELLGLIEKVMTRGKRTSPRFSSLGRTAVVGGR